jgi:hypothetical protein
MNPITKVLLNTAGLLWTFRRLQSDLMDTINQNWTVADTEECKYVPFFSNFPRENLDVGPSRAPIYLSVSRARPKLKFSRTLWSNCPRCRGRESGRVGLILTVRIVINSAQIDATSPKELMGRNCSRAAETGSRR